MKYRRKYETKGKVQKENVGEKLPRKSQQIAGGKRANNEMRLQECESSSDPARADTSSVPYQRD